MRTRNLIAHFIFVVSLVALITPASATAQSKPVDFSAQIATVTEFDVNGLKVIVKRREAAPTVSGGLFIRGGVRNIDDKTAGIENLTLTSATEAGVKMPRAMVRRELSRLGSSIGAASGSDYSAVAFGTTRESFDRVWEIFTELLLRPAFAKADVDRNRDLILSGLRETGTSPESALEELQQRVVYAGHPYANDVTGTPANLAKFTPADLAAYHKKVMQTSQLLLVFVGDLDPEELKTRIAATFGKLPRGDYKAEPLPAIGFEKGTVDSVQRSLPTNYVKGVFAAPSLNDPDYYAMRVSMSILQTLVYQEVRNRLQLSYAPDAEMNSLAANTASISASTTDPNAATTAMLNQIKLLQERDLNAAIIDDVASFYLTRHYMSQETNSVQVAELAKYELIGGGWRKSFEFLNGIRSVTPEQIQSVSRKYMKNIRFAIVGNEAAINKAVFVPAE